MTTLPRARRLIEAPEYTVGGPPSDYADPVWHLSGSPGETAHLDTVGDKVYLKRRLLSRSPGQVERAVKIRVPPDHPKVVAYLAAKATAVAEVNAPAGYWGPLASAARRAVNDRAIALRQDPELLAQLDQAAQAKLDQLNTVVHRRAVRAKLPVVTFDRRRDVVPHLNDVKYTIVHTGVDNYDELSVLMAERAPGDVVVKIGFTAESNNFIYVVDQPEAIDRALRMAQRQKVMKALGR